MELASQHHCSQFQRVMFADLLISIVVVQLQRDASIYSIECTDSLGTGLFTQRECGVVTHCHHGTTFMK